MVEEHRRCATFERDERGQDATCDPRLARLWPFRRLGRARRRCRGGAWGGVFSPRPVAADRSKPCSRQNCRRTAARVSAKVGRGLRYQASVRTAERARRSRRAASSVTIENSASRQGVVRAMARSDHWRWVSTPRWSRTSRKVTSTCQRWTNQRTICSGSRAGSVQSRACGSKRCRGSRSSTQRIGTTGEPAWRQTAVAGADLDDALALAVPAGHGDLRPARARVGQDVGEVRQAGALGPRAPDRPGPPRRGRLVQGRVQPQAGDADQAVPGERRQEFQGGEAAVAQQHDLAPGQPAACLQAPSAAPSRSASCAAGRARGSSAPKVPARSGTARPRRAPPRGSGPGASG